LPAAAPSAVDLIVEMRALHARGEPADVRAVLARYPGLTPDRQTLIDLACEEFSLRRAAGEELDCAEFAGRFPGFGTSVRDLLLTRAFVDAALPDDLFEGMALSWPRPGECLLGFALLEELGRGSYSRVFLARQPDVADRLVVVKVSFLDGAPEAEALGSLSHPNIVPILSLHGGEEGGWTAVCMPYHGTATLDGVLERLHRPGGRPRHARALLDAVRAAPLPAEPTREGAEPHPLLRHGSYVDGALHLGAQLADAVAYVHAQDICHRDLKPANVLLTPDGRPLLLDFNLSHTPDGPDQGPGGTLPYMAPEQIRALARAADGKAETGDKRSDVYALGVVLYELLSGRHPFGPFPANLSRRQFAHWLLERQRGGPQPIRRLSAEVDGAVARLLDRCLSADTEQRPSARELAEALSRALTLPRRVARSARRNRWPLAGAAALVLCGALFGLFGPARSSPARVDHWGLGTAALREGRHGEAVQHFTSVLNSEGASARVLFARGVARYRMKDFAQALEDLTEADSMGKDGKIKAALGICHVQPNADRPRTNHEDAIWYYREAIRAGYGTARVYNNLGYSLALRGQASKSGRPGDFKEAREAFAEAILRDPNLQAAYYNRAVLCLWGVHGKPGGRLALREVRGDEDRSLQLLLAAIHDIETAVKLGPRTPELYRDAARLYALAAHLDNDEGLPQRGLQHLAKAVDLGCPVGDLRRDPFLRPGLRQGFEGILNRPGPRTAAGKIVRCPDPIEAQPHGI
jgi:serine/threonine protein kinase/Flp pilus assembly protein TadD